MSLAAAQSTIQTAVATASGCTDVQWGGTARAARFGKGPQIDLTAKGEASVGVDETRRELNVSDKLDETQVGQRTLTVSVRIESDSAALASSAQAVASRLRTRLRYPRVLKALRLGGVALIEILPTADGVYRSADKRLVSVAVTDVVFGFVDVDTDTSAPGDRIKSAEVRSEYLTHADGTPGAIQLAVEGP